MAQSRIRLLVDSDSDRFVKRVGELPESSEFELLTYVKQDKSRIADLLRQADAAYIYQDELRGPAIRSAPALKFIQKHGLNCKNIDLDAAHEKGVRVATLPLFRNVAVAEHAMALMLACSHKIVQGHRAVESAVYRDLGLEPIKTAQREYRSNWAKITGVMELMDATVGIVGLGDIGLEIARRCRAFGMKVVYHQRARHTPAVEAEYEATYLPMTDLLRTVDHLVLILPHTASTDRMIGAAELKLMKPTATLINVARGGVVDETALIEALSNGTIAMAGLDVYREEPLPVTSPLITMPNVVLTPHLGGGSYRSHEVDHKSGLQNILQFFRTGSARGLVAPR